MTQAEEQERQSVVQEALSWIGTPYHHAAGVKGCGVDCAYLLIEVYSRCGIVPRINPGPYKGNIATFVKGQRLYRRIVSSLSRQVRRPPRPGDVAVFMVNIGGRHRNFLATHGGIVIEWPRVVHALQGRGVLEEMVYEHHPLLRLDSFWSPHKWT